MDWYGLAKAYRCSVSAECDGQKLYVYCVDGPVVNDENGAYCKHAPFCAEDIFGATLDVTCEPSPNGVTQELFVFIINDVDPVGTWKFHLYYEGIEVDASPVVDYVDGSYAQWYGYNPGEIWYNGSYEYKVEDPYGTIISSQTFTVTGAQEKEGTLQFKVIDKSNAQPIENAYVLVTAPSYRAGDYTGSDGLTLWFPLSFDVVYTIKVTKDGYHDWTEDIYFEETEDGGTITCQIEPDIECSDYTTQTECESAGCFWFNNACHEYGPVECSDYDDAITCNMNNCYWYDDECHAIPENCEALQLLLQEHFNEKVSDNPCLSHIDLNGDGTINILDLQILAAMSEADCTSHLHDYNDCLLPDEGTIRVSSTPPDAEIWVKPFGTSEFVYSGYKTTESGLLLGGLPTGLCSVKVKKEGYAEATKDVTIVKNEVVDVHFNLTIEPDYGVIVPIINMPEGGVKVQGTGSPVPDKTCDELSWQFYKEHIIVPPATEALFDNDDIPEPGINWCFRVVTNDSDEYEIDYTKKPWNVPSDNVNTLTPPLNAYNGSRFRISLISSHDKQEVNAPFVLTATVFSPPYSLEPAGAGYVVQLYEGEIPIGAPKVTNENGEVTFAGITKIDVGTYTYFAKLKDYTSWLEPSLGVTVEIVEKLEGWWDNIISWIMTTFGITDRGQAEIIAYAMIGVGGLFVVSLVTK